ncbi:hypothetical protein H696_02908 [Fonticula alba]|uniref:Coatomer subunit gamma n=1 Tax=Fonticula alba TaxID=691883 RepID=A0A058Z9I1_FONAL|nr:hypothetical protein H696_02908 [Fonticula alba]KCV70563.1 hypothetical protein H696_02908 [Fonticula alba]|eukprot:XP_009495079.1 hypothetical protein H696_02908 [Fonticula alba]
MMPVGAMGGAMRSKDEDSHDRSRFSQVDKYTVLQDARVFNNAGSDNITKCLQVLTRIMYLRTCKGEAFTEQEATNLFFAVTKLFQSRDVNLRRVVYLTIKELAPMASDVIMITSSLIRDVSSASSSVDVAAGEGAIYRANALRALISIVMTDPSVLPSVERLIRQAIVDRSPVVSSAALVSSLRLLYTGGSSASMIRETIRRWIQEATEAISRQSPMIKYHAMALICEIRSRDRTAVLKFLQSIMQSVNAGFIGNSPHATMMLARHIGTILREESPDSGARKQFYPMLESLVRYKSDMVVLEAARAIAALPSVTSRELLPAISALQQFLSSARPLFRFSALRTLAQIAASHPLSVSQCNLDIEALVADPNRSIATLAVTTLLKTGSEASVDRLLVQVEALMPEMPDEFRCVLVDAVRALFFKFPSKQTRLFHFLASCLRDDGGLAFKRSLVDALITCAHNVPESREFALLHLCEFIEDCEFPALAIRVLNFLGAEAPNTSCPGKFIRYINNRVILESAPVRAAACSALAKFALSPPPSSVPLPSAGGDELSREDYMLALRTARETHASLRKSVRVLLERCTRDADDEVRDRASYYCSLIDAVMLQSALAAGGGAKPGAAETGFGESDFADAMGTPLEEELLGYIGAKDTIIVPNAKDILDASTLSPGAASGTALSPGGAAAGNDFAKLADVSSVLLSVPQLSPYGVPLRSSAGPVPLTEAGTEFSVALVKHIYKSVVVLQFDIANTLAEQQIEDVSVELDLDQYGGICQAELVLPAPVIGPNETARSFIVLRATESVPVTEDTVLTPEMAAVGAVTMPIVASFGTHLLFTVRDIDPDTMEPSPSSYTDRYDLEPVEITLADNMIASGPAPPSLAQASFRDAWSLFNKNTEFSETYTLPVSAEQAPLQALVRSVIGLLGMRASDGSETVLSSPDTGEEAHTHTLLLSGRLLGRQPPCLIRVRLVRVSADSSPTGIPAIVMQITVRAPDHPTAEFIARLIA